MKDIEIFNLDSRLKTGLIIFAIAAQICSGVTEYLGLAPFIKDVLLTTAPSYADWLSHAIAISLAIFIEFVILYAVSFIIWAIKKKYWQKGKEIDLIFNRIKFGSAIVGLVVLVIVSMTLSKRNVKFQIAATPIKVSTAGTDKQDDRQDNKEAAAKDQYTTEKIALDASYNESKQIIQNTYLARIDIEQRKIETLERKQQKTGLSYRTSILNARKEIAKFKTKEGEELQKLKAGYDNDLKGIKATRDNYIVANTAIISSARDKAILKEDELTEATKKRNKWVAYVLSIIAQCSVLGAVIARAWVCMSDATSGIEIKPLPLPESFSDNVIVELITLCILFPSRHLQNLVRMGLEKVPVLRDLKNKGAILNLEDNTDPFFSSKGYSDKSDPVQSNQWSDILGKTLGEPEPDKYFSSNQTDGSNSSGMMQERRPIGFKGSDKQTDAEKPILKSYVDDSIETKVRVVEVEKGFTKKCEHCGEDFTPNHKKHRFCKEKCRKRAWEKKTGRELKLRPKK